MIEKLNKEQKEFVRNLRHGRIMHSWRRIAELFVEKYDIDHDLHDNQLYGIELCQMADCYHDED